MIVTRHAICALGLTLVCVITQAYDLRDSYMGNQFLDEWTWETMDDPTHGRVNYVDKATALRSNLSYSKPFASLSSAVVLIHFIPHVSLLRQICDACRSQRYG